MPINGSNKKEYQREYMKRKRSNTKEGLTGQGLTTKYPYIIHSLTDQGKRDKLTKIIGSLDSRPQLKLLDEVRYGIHGPTMRAMRELLAITA